VEEHNFCWKDKMNDKPWEVLRAPAHIPKFRLDYGRKEAPTKEKRGKKRKRQSKTKVDYPLLKDFLALHNIRKMREKGHPNPTSEVQGLVRAPKRRRRNKNVQKDYSE
jgi:hypothetical protein